MPTGATAITGAVCVAGYLRLTREFRGRCGSFDVQTQFAGTSGRPPLLDAFACRGWRGQVGLDFLFIAGCLGLSVAILTCGWLRYRTRQLVRLTAVVLAVPVVAALADGAENLALLGGLTEHRGFLVFRQEFWAVAVSVLAWTKWIAAVALVVLVLMSLVTLTRPPVRLLDAPVDLGKRSSRAVPTDAWGMCVSGGGIRAAAFGLGSLSVLEREIAARCRWISAVSGGAYAATAWSLARSTGPARQGTTVAADIHRYLMATNRHTGRPNFQYLFNAPGGLARSVGRALAGVLVSLAVIGLFFLVLAWPLGRVVGSDVMHPELRGVRGAQLAQRYVAVPQQWWPAVIFLGASVLVLLVAAVLGRPRWRVGVLAFALFLLAVTFAVLLVVVPVVVVRVGTVLGGGSSGAVTALLGGSSALAAIGMIWRVVSTPALAAVSTALPRLGGLLLLLAGLLWSSWVMVDAATATGGLRGTGTWVIATAAFFLVYLAMGRIRGTFSFQRIYGRSLVRTFGLSRDAAGDIGHHPDAPITWDQLSTGGPELVLCCTQASADLGAGGFRAESFTISPSTVRWAGSSGGGSHDRTVRREFSCATDEYLDRFPGSAHRTVAAWMGVSGAAFASTMGRASLGSTGALLAAANVSLGSWMVNPGLVPEGGARLRTPGLAYLWKEILGWYNDNDAYLYVTDGGHWDNLGLVELLRRGCRYVVCVDASGDARSDGTQTFSTLRQSLKLATLELDTITDVEVSGLDAITGTRRPAAGHAGRRPDRAGRGRGGGQPHLLREGPGVLDAGAGAAGVRGVGSQVPQLLHRRPVPHPRPVR